MGFRDTQHPMGIRDTQRLGDTLLCWVKMGFVYTQRLYDILEYPATKSG